MSKGAVTNAVQRALQNGLAWRFRRSCALRFSEGILISAPDRTHSSRRSTPEEMDALECLRFSGESTVFGIGETKTLATDAVLQRAVPFLEIFRSRQTDGG
jgi:hypothetical protein